MQPYRLSKHTDKNEISKVLTGNPFKNYIKKVKNLRVRIDTKVFLAVLISGGLRPNEAINYKYDSSFDNEIVVKVPILKKKRKVKLQNRHNVKDVPERTLRIIPEEWGLTEEDFRKYQDNMKTYRTYLRETQRHLKMCPRDIRVVLLIWISNNYSDHVARDFVFHSSTLTVQHYLKQLNIDNIDIRNPKEYKKKVLSNYIWA